MNRSTSFSRRATGAAFKVLGAIDHALHPDKAWANGRKPQRILAICLSHLGDLVLLTPLFANLRLAYPKAHLTVVCKSVVADIPGNHPAVDEVITYEARWILRPTSPRAGLLDTVKLIRRLRDGSYDLLVVCYDHPMDRILGFYTGIPAQVSLPDAAKYGRTPSPVRRLTDTLSPRGARGRIRPISSPSPQGGEGANSGNTPPLSQGGEGTLSTNKSPLPRGGESGDSLEGSQVRHRVEHAFDLLRALDVPIVDTAPSLGVAAADAAWADGWIREQGLSGKTILGVHPGAGGPEKRWPADRFARVAEDLAQRYPCKVVVTGGPVDEEAVKNFMQKVGCEAVQAPMTLSVARLCALIQRFAVLLCNDCGPMHIAAALRVPVIAVFGPGFPQLWGPYPPDPHHVVVAARDSKIESVTPADVLAAIDGSPLAAWFGEESTATINCN